MKKAIPLLLVVLAAAALIGVFLNSKQAEQSETAPPVEEVEPPMVEHNPAPELTSVVWHWVEFQGMDESTSIKDPENYTILFDKDGRYFLKADCNQGNGDYVSASSSLMIKPGALTMAMCPPQSKSDEYLVRLGEVRTFVINDGKLYMNLMADAGNMVFEKSGLSQNPENGLYMIDDVKTRLVDGKAEKEAAPGSASKIITTMWEKPTYGDLTGTPTKDSALILNQQTGGSGSFYYVTVALEEGELYKGINAVLLGDRVAIQDFSIEENQVVVNYAKHADDQSMTDAPSEAMTMKLVVKNDELVEVK